MYRSVFCYITLLFFCNVNTRYTHVNLILFKLGMLQIISIWFYYVLLFSGKYEIKAQDFKKTFQPDSKFYASFWVISLTVIHNKDTGMIYYEAQLIKATTVELWSLLFVIFILESKFADFKDQPYKQNYVYMNMFSYIGDNRNQNCKRNLI